MAIYPKGAGPDFRFTERRGASLASLFGLPPGRPVQAIRGEPYAMILLAEEAHEADRIEQAKKLIEEAYELYDQYDHVADDSASDAMPPRKRRQAT